MRFEITKKQMIEILEHWGFEVKELDYEIKIEDGDYEDKVIISKWKLDQLKLKYICDGKSKDMQRIKIKKDDIYTLLWRDKGIWSEF